MVTLTPRFKTNGICYSYLKGHTCEGCDRNKITCPAQQAELLKPLTAEDKLIIEAAMGEAEEFDKGTQANEIIRDILKQKAHVTMRVYGKELVPGVEYD